MMIKPFKSYLLTLVLVIGSVTTHAQKQMPGAGTPPIEVGSTLADVSAHLEDGSLYPLREKLKGKHAVLVFGCLT